MDNEILLEHVKSDISKNQLLTIGDGVVAGVSGGADSVCLLKVLKELQHEFRLTLTAVHVHHGLRGEEADEDQAYVEKLCQDWDIPLKSLKVDLNEISKKNGISLEEAGREVRYSFFNQVLKDTHSQYIAVAHHREDQAETVMLHLLRGTGLDGLCGMSMKQGRVIRPLLNISRKQIERYLEENRISYRIDSSNLTDAYTRNRIRNTLFPMIAEMFGVNPTTQLTRLSAIVQEEREYLEDAADKAFSRVLLKSADSVALSIEGLKSFPKTLTKRIIRRAWEKIIGSRKNLEQVHVEQILNLWENGHTGKKIQLPQGVEVKVSYDELIFSKRAEEGQEPYCYPVEKEGLTKVDQVKGTLHARLMPASEAYLQLGSPETIKENSLVQLFDCDRLEGEIKVRSRKDGDRIRPYKMGGEKKLKEFFIDQKVPQELRSRIPLVALGSRVVWIVGMRTSEDFRARRDTQNVWVLSWCYLQDGGEETWQR